MAENAALRRGVASLPAAVLAVTVGMAAGTCVPSPTQREPEPRTAFGAAFGACGDPCRIAGNDGGELGPYLAAAAEVNAGGRLVVIDGPCRSACAAFADRARAHVCITPNARFGFHEASVYTADLRQRLASIAPPQSPDILVWVAANGGFPAGGFREMTAADAARFWRRCTPAERAAAAR